jgi:hypothetical protein
LLIANLADQEECSVRLAGHLQRAEELSRDQAEQDKGALDGLRAERDEAKQGWLAQAERDAAEIVRLGAERDRLRKVAHFAEGEARCAELQRDEYHQHALRACAERDRLQRESGKAVEVVAGLIAERDRLRVELRKAIDALRDVTDGCGDPESEKKGRAIVIAYYAKAKEAPCGE